MISWVIHLFSPHKMIYLYVMVNPQDQSRLSSASLWSLTCTGLTCSLQVCHLTDRDVMLITPYLHLPNVIDSLLGTTIAVKHFITKQILIHNRLIEMHGNVVIGISAWHAVIRGSILGPGMLYLETVHLGL